MEAKITKDSNNRRSTFRDLDLGQIAVINDHESRDIGKLVVRTASHVIQLTAPYYTYSPTVEIEVRILSTGAEVTLTQE